MLLRSSIDVAGLITAAARPDCGALATFVGTTRDTHGGRRVLRLEYQAYESMAISALERLERSALERFEIVSCAVVHRLGEVPLAEASVVVVVAAAHRAAAFDACRWVMDELKRSAPIWKKEFYADGDAVWVKGSVLGA